MLAGNLKKPAKQGCYVSCFRPTPPLSNNSTLSLASPPWHVCLLIFCTIFWWEFFANLLKKPNLLGRNDIFSWNIFILDCDLWISQKHPKEWTTYQSPNWNNWNLETKVWNQNPPHQSHRVSNFCWLMLIRNCFGKQFLFFIIEDIGLIYLLKISVFTLKN